MTQHPTDDLVSLDVSSPIWSRFFKVSALVLIGTKDESGDYNQAPKHMAMPLGWENYFGFICTPDHSTYHNVNREGVFSVTYPRSTQIVLSSLAAAPRDDDNFKPSLTALSTFSTMEIDGRFVKDGYAFLECEHIQTVDGFGKNSLIAGKVVAAAVDRSSLRLSDVDDGEQLNRSPILAYLDPERFARIETTYSFPLPKGFSR